MEDGRIIDEPDVIQGAVLMRKGAEEDSPRSTPFTRKYTNSTTAFCLPA
jgi:hypothetical protein